jgi:hypothetical protein
MVDKCIIKDTNIFECFSMHLGVFIVYFIVLVVYLNVIQCIYGIFQYILMCLKVFECIWIYLNAYIVYL